MSKLQSSYLSFSKQVNRINLIMYLSSLLKAIVTCLFVICSFSSVFGFDQRVVDSLNQEAEHYRIAGKYGESVNIHQQLLEYFLARHDSVNVAREYFQIGRLNYYMRTTTSNAESLEYWLRGLKLAQKLQDKNTMLRFHRGLGVIYGEPTWERFSSDSSRKHLLKAELLAAEVEDYYSLSAIQGIIGNYASVNQDYQEAEQYLNRSFETALKSDSSEAIGYALCKLSEFYEKTGAVEKAEITALESFHIYQELQIKDMTILPLLVLGKISRRRNDLNAYIYYDSIINSMQAELYAERNIQEFHHVREKYESEKKEQELQLLTVEKELQQAEIEQTRLLVLVVSVLAIFIIASILLVNSRKRYKLKAELAEEKERLQKNRFKAVIDAEEKERKRIAQELHDGLGQLLSTARITVSSLDELKNPKVTNSVKLIDMAVKEVRSISHNMMPNALVNVGLKAALEDVMRKVNESGRVEGVFECDDEIILEESQAISLYRIAQELINNALKYANPSEIKLKLTVDGEFLIMMVSDDGVGFDVSALNKSTGIGWSNIQSRVDLLNGRFEVNSAPLEGTITKVILSPPIIQKAS